LSRMKKVLATVVTSVLLLGMMSAPAFAFIHDTIPAGTCAASGQAGDNETAEAAIVKHNKAQGQDLPIGNSQGANQSQAPCNS
jgi:hypothetical protein